jgi:predicted site-specific integrase-resolvase
MSAKFVKPKRAEEIFGVHRRTLKKWADEGHIKSFRPGGSGQTLFDISTATGADHGARGGEHGVAKTIGTEESKGPEQRVDAVYARVSTRKQACDLERQLAALRSDHPDAVVFSDIASGINFKRRGLRALLKLAFEGRLRRVHVAHRDRLCRFAYDLVEHVLAHHGATVVVDATESTSDEQDLAEDVLAIVSVFGAKLHGKRGGQGRRRRAQSKAAQAEGSPSDVDSGPSHVESGQAAQPTEEGAVV